MALDQLASEDALRLAVLLAGEVLAVRIDDAGQTLHALTPRGEARVVLHPDTRPERYLQRVREVLAGAAMGSPGGYPVHLRRWTRSGHANPRNLEALLRLGEPEAVTAVSLSAHLSDELARRAWWAQPEPEIARHMLGHEAVRRGTMGPVLARYLLEHLPFEADPDAAVASVGAIAAAGLLDEAARSRLWRAGQQRPHLLIGWLAHAPQTLPPAPARELPPAVATAAAGGDALAALALRCASAEGQGFLRALSLVLEKLPTHEAAGRALEIVAGWFADGVAARPHGSEASPTSAASARSASSPPSTLPGLAPALAAALTALATPQAEAARAILARSSAVGSLMRRHLAPVLEPMQRQLRVLQGQP